jgi:glutamate-5-semialdehyde dehydrogenase
MFRMVNTTFYGTKAENFSLIPLALAGGLGHGCAMADGITTAPGLEAEMHAMAARARRASAALASAGAEQRTEALRRMATRVRGASGTILAANGEDMRLAKEKALTDALLDRLELSEERIEAIATGLEAVAALNDPVGRELARWTVPSGLDIARVATPLGVIGIIYESRPNVTADAGALCVRSGNAAILRGGSESLQSSGAIARALREGLADARLPEDAVQLVQTTDRAAVGHILSGLAGQLDVIVPRGGKSLVARVQAEARVPVIGHLEGLCHTYVDGSADPASAVEICLNAKMRRTGICGAMETLLVDRDRAPALLPPIADALRAAGCALRGDAGAREIVREMDAATEDDWTTEYLAPVLSVALVDGVDGAIEHIARFGSGHTEAVIAEDEAVARKFLSEVDAGIVMHNASTQFADGGEFGMGAEIGIATGRIHARGPVGADQLTIFKYVVRGAGQTRP